MEVLQRGPGGSVERSPPEAEAFCTFALILKNGFTTAEPVRLDVYQ